MKFLKMIVPATNDTINHAYNELGYRFSSPCKEVKGFLVTDETGLMAILENFPEKINIGSPSKEYTVSDFLRLERTIVKEYTPDDFRKEITEIMDKVDFLYSKGYSVYITGAWIGNMDSQHKVITLGDTEGWREK